MVKLEELRAIYRLKCILLTVFYLFQVLRVQLFGKMTRPLYSDVLVLYFNTQCFIVETTFSDTLKKEKYSCLFDLLLT